MIPSFPAHSRRLGLIPRNAAICRWFSFGNTGAPPFNSLRNQQQRDFSKHFLSKFHGRAAPDQQLIAEKNLSRRVWMRGFCWVWSVRRSLSSDQLSIFVTPGDCYGPRHHEYVLGIRPP